MRKLIYAAAAACLLLMCAGIALAQAGGDQPLAGLIDPKAMIVYAVGLIMSWVIGGAWKRADGTSNETIPLVIGLTCGALGALGAWLLNIPWKDVAIAAIGAAWSAIAGYEAAKSRLQSPMKAGGGS